MGVWYIIILTSPGVVLFKDFRQVSAANRPGIWSHAAEKSKFIVHFKSLIYLRANCRLMELGSFPL